MMLWRGIFTLTLLAGLASAGADQAWSAGSAYQVDTGLVGEPGSCKVDTWASTAARHGFFFAMSPTCVFGLGHPVEFNTQFSRARVDDEWSTAALPKLKTNIIPGGGVGQWSVAIAAAGAYDATEQKWTALNFTVPATLRVTENLRVNLNAGYLRGLIEGRDFFTYGAAFDLRTPDNVWTVTGEVFGALGSSREDDAPGELKPRWQLGLRWRPVDRWNVDVIYGRNLIGETANWITFATTMRFDIGK